MLIYVVTSRIFFLSEIVDLLLRMLAFTAHWKFNKIFQTIIVVMVKMVPKIFQRVCFQTPSSSVISHVIARASFVRMQIQHPYLTIRTLTINSWTILADDSSDINSDVSSYDFFPVIRR